MVANGIKARINPTYFIDRIHFGTVVLRSNISNYRRIALQLYSLGDNDLLVNLYVQRSQFDVDQYYYDVPNDWTNAPELKVAQPSFSNQVAAYYNSDPLRYYVDWPYVGSSQVRARTDVDDVYTSQQYGQIWIIYWRNGQTWTLQTQITTYAVPASGWQINFASNYYNWYHTPQ
ncbi:MAG: hypothetical protein Kow00129_16800 [Thermoleophilia bacterium]